jgi:hypothetical protein
MRLPERKSSLRKSDMTLLEKVRFAVLVTATSLQIIYIVDTVQVQLVGDGGPNPSLRTHLTNGQWQGIGWAAIMFAVIGILMCVRRRLTLCVIAAAAAASGLLFGNVLGYPEIHGWLVLVVIALFFVVLPVILDGFNDLARAIMNLHDRRIARKKPSR